VINDPSIKVNNSLNVARKECSQNVHFDVSLQANNFSENCEVALREFDQDQTLQRDTGEHFEELLDFINAPSDDSVNNSIAGELYLDNFLPSDRSALNSTTAEGFEFLLSGQMVRTLSCDPDVVIKRFHLKKVESPADGSCILHSWKETTGMSLRDIKAAILNEYHVKSVEYCKRGIDEHELLQYLNCHHYDTGTVDSIPEMLVNATGKTLYVLENRFHNKSFPTSIIKIAVPCVEPCCDSVFFFKTGDHYDALLDSPFTKLVDIT